MIEAKKNDDNDRHFCSNCDAPPSVNCLMISLVKMADHEFMTEPEPADSSYKDEHRPADYYAKFTEMPEVDPSSEHAETNQLTIYICSDCAEELSKALIQ